MDKTFNSIVGGPGRHTRKLMVRSRRNHFSVKGLFDDIGSGIKQGSKNLTDSIVKNVGKRAGADPERVQQMINTSKGYNQAREKFANTTKDVTRDAAISIATLGVGAAASGLKTAGQGVAAGVNAGKAAQTATTATQAATGAVKAANVANVASKGLNIGKIAGDAAKIASAGGAALTALKSKKPKDAIKAAGAAADAAGVDYKKTAEQFVPEVYSPAYKQAADSIGNIANSMPPEIQDQLKKAAKKGAKLDLTDIVANNRTSPETLPKRRSSKQNEDVASLLSDGKMRASEMAPDGFSMSTGMYIAVGVVILVVIFFMLRR